MVHVTILFVALIASLCEVTLGASMQCCRPCQAAPAQPRIVPRVPVPCARVYECTLEDIISRLVNALIYISIHNSCPGGGGRGGRTGGGTGSSGGSGTGGSGTGGSDRSLINALIELGDTDLIDLGILPRIIRSGTGGGTSGSTGGSGGSGTGGSGTGGSDSSLLNALIGLGDTELLDLEVLPGIIRSGTSGGTSGGTSASGTGSGTGSKSSSGSSLLQALLDLKVALGGTDVVDLGVLRGTAQ